MLSVKQQQQQQPQQTAQKQQQQQQHEQPPPKAQHEFQRPASRPRKPEVAATSGARHQDSGVQIKLGNIKRNNNNTKSAALLASLTATSQSTIIEPSDHVTSYLMRNNRQSQPQLDIQTMTTTTLTMASATGGCGAGSPSSMSSSSSSSSSGVSSGLNSVASPASTSPTSSAGGSPTRMSILDGLLTSWSPAHDAHSLSGLTLTWSHGANSRASLAAALASNKLVVSGDISLAEMSRYPVPIMAQQVGSNAKTTAPAGDQTSDLTLDCWLQEVTRTGQQQKAIKLTFTSTRTVEPALRVLTRHAERLRGPLILAANIMGPGAGSAKSEEEKDGELAGQPVDAWTFLMLCQAKFPRSIISIGWCSPTDNLTATGPASSRSLAGPVTAPTARRESFDSLQVLAASAAAADPIFELDILADHYRPRATPQIMHALQSGKKQAIAAKLPAIENTTSKAAASREPSLATSGSSGCSSGSPSPTSQANQTKSSFLMLAAAAAAATSSANSIKLKSTATGGSYHQLINQLHQHQPLNLNISDCVAEAKVKSRVDTIGGDLLLLKSSSSSSSQSMTLTTTTTTSKLSAQLQGGYQHHDNMLLSRRLMGFYDESPLLAPSLTNPNFTTHINKKVASMSANLYPQTLSCHSSTSIITQQQQQKATSGNNNSVAIDGDQNYYTREMIDEMASVVKKYNLTQPITFPVFAKFILRQQNSLIELQRLLYLVGGNSTLTIVAQQDDLIKIDDLLVICKAFAANQLLFDLPDELAGAFRRALEGAAIS